MKRNWTEEELVERWTLFPDELALLSNKTGHTRLGFTVMPRFFAGEGRFPRDKHEVAAEVLRFVGEQVGEPAEGWLCYDWGGRSIKYHRAEVRDFFGFREAKQRRRLRECDQARRPHWTTSPARSANRASSSLWDTTSLAAALADCRWSASCWRPCGT